MRLTVIFFLLLSCASCSNPHPGFNAVEEGVWHKVRYFTEEGQKPDIGDMVRLQIMLQVDSVLLLNPEKPIILPYDTAKKGLQRILGRYHVGDSVSFKFSGDYLRREFLVSNAKSELSYQAEMKVLGMIKRSDWERDKAIERELNLEVQQMRIDGFIEDSDLEYSDWKGMKVHRYTPDDSIRITPDQPLFVYYVARTLDGRVVDTRLASEDYISYTLGMKGQLIRGLEIMISDMYINERVDIIIPFDLAFGERGVQGEIVPPYCPLHYTLIIRDSSNNNQDFDV